MNTRPIHFVIHVVVAGFLACAPVPVVAQSVPQLINYQGKLVSSNGLPVSTGDYELRFRIWDAATGGNLVWGPQVFNGQTGPGFGPLVPVVQGWFNVILGPVATNGALVTGVFNSSNRFIEIQLGMSTPFGPRQQIMSAPFSLRAASAANADFATTAQQAAMAQVAITASNVVNSPIPSGVIVMWSGSLTSVPPGWALCNGSSGTPDLRNRFVVGADQNQGGVARSSIEGTPLQTGGRTAHDHSGETGKHTLTIAETPSHSHSLPIGELNGDSGNAKGAVFSNSLAQESITSFNVMSRSSGGDQGHSHAIGSDAHIPPYFALAFIVKL